MKGRRPVAESELRQIGKVVGPFGIKGMLKVQPETDFLERFEPGRTIFIKGLPYNILQTQQHKDQFRLMLDGISTVEQVEELRWAKVCVPLSDRPQLDEGEYLHEDLVGLIIIEGSKEIGKVADVLRAGAQDLLSVNGVLIPVHPQFIKDVDLAKGQIVVELIEGMRPGDEAEEVR